MQESFKSKSHKFNQKENKEYFLEFDKSSIKNGSTQHHDCKETAETAPKTREKDCSYSDRWDQLIYIEMQFYIEDVLIKDEFLWQKTNTSLKDVKDFAYNYLFDNLPQNLNKFSFEFFEFCAEYIVSLILKEIDFYEKFDFYKYFETGLFGSGIGLFKEHLIPINLELKHNEIVFKDSFDYDILNSTNKPEILANCIVSDMKLPKEFFNLISMNIRRQIRDHVFTTLQNFSSFCQIYKENNGKNNKKFIVKLKKSEKNGYSKNHDDLDIDDHINNDKVENSTKENTENILHHEGFLFENKLENELGPLHKFKHTTRETKFHKPLFLKNRLQNKKKLVLKGLKNKMILYTDPNRIIISKNILKNETDIDRIVIDKNKIKSFYS